MPRTAPFESHHRRYAVAEALPFAGGLFDRALCVTTICFVDDAGGPRT